nr:MAG TPA: hypothetical protein [Caudoviricetes sp.]
MKASLFGADVFVPGMTLNCSPLQSERLDVA